MSGYLSWNPIQPFCRENLLSWSFISMLAQPFDNRIEYISDTFLSVWEKFEFVVSSNKKNAGCNRDPWVWFSKLMTCIMFCRNVSQAPRPPFKIGLKANCVPCLCFVFPCLRFRTKVQRHRYVPTQPNVTFIFLSI